MQGGQFPASAAKSLIEGYCDDFVSLSAILSQTLEQVSFRGIGFDSSRPALERIERGMRELATAIREMLERGAVTANADTVQPETDAPMPGPSPMAHGPLPPRASPRSTVPPLSGKTAPSAPLRAATPPSPPPRVAPTAPPKPAAARPAPTPPRAPSPPAPAPVAPAPARPVEESVATPNPDRVPAPKRDTKTEGLRGTNRTMPLQSVFQFLGRMRKSGTLHVFVGDEVIAFEFVNGCIEFTATTRCPLNERLGEILVELDFCTRDELAPFLAKVGVSSANRLGQLVVDARLVSNGQVLEALEAQVRRRFQRVCASGDAAYEFETGQRGPGDGRIRIAPFELRIDQPWKLRSP